MGATVEVLSALPEDHPDRPALLAILKKHIDGVKATQPQSGVCLRHADGKQAFGVHVAEAFARKGGIAIVLGGSRSKRALPEAARALDEFGLLALESKGRRVEHRGIIPLTLLAAH